MRQIRKQNGAFSGSDRIPKGRAPDTITPGCLVLEGGAFRAVYGEGVLDALMRAGLNFQCTIGVSAGALNGFNYVSGQIGRAARINLNYRHDSRYVGLGAYRTSGSVIGFRFAFEDFDRIEPLDRARFFDPARRFLAVATDCRTGQPVYFEKGRCGDIFRAICASASMPYFSRPVEVDGITCLDGGCCQKIPYQWALDQNFEKIVLVRTLTMDFRREEKASDQKLANLVYGRKYPAFAAVQGQSAAAANRQCDEIEALAAAGRIFVIAPSKDLGISKLEKDVNRLAAWYVLGYNDCKRALPALKAWLRS